MSSNTCANCGSSFPNKKIIDGKERVLNSRKYCLECSPFGEHNTKTLEEDGGVCKYCNREYELDRDKGHSKNVCNSCRVKRRRRKKKQELVKMFGGECIECGYNLCYSALTFHHRKPSNKEFKVSNSVAQRNWQSVIEEAEKCDLLCQNCHQQLHCNNC